MRATVGRIVHYVSYGTPGGEYPSVCRAAMVTEDEHWHGGRNRVSLAVINPEGMFFNRDVRWHDTAEGLVGGTWHWPEREE